MLTVDDFDFDLPEHLIAQRPSEKRGGSRLLNALQASLQIQDFSSVTELFKGGELLVINNTKVVPARLFAKKESGASIEIFFLKLLGEVEDQQGSCVEITAMTKGKIKIGHRIDLPLGLKAELISKDDFGHATLRLYGLNRDRFWAWLEEAGKMPLPPYINREADLNDQERYQTVFAKHAGAVASPTAGLHFTTEILDALKQKGVQLCEITLHVGAGTFLPIKEKNIAQHHMHSEAFSIPPETRAALSLAVEEKRPIIAVGTTVVRALESYAINPDLNETNIFITPGFDFKLTDGLFTNFHLPKSTLLILLSAFIGKARIFEVYQRAIAEGLKFYSYGDSSVFCRNNGRWKAWI
jgi:S-adenosylmethionine:tRNA ribosyltransferase-isomerase